MSKCSKNSAAVPDFVIGVAVYGLQICLSTTCDGLLTIRRGLTFVYYGEQTINTQPDNSIYLVRSNGLLKES